MSGYQLLARDSVENTTEDHACSEAGPSHDSEPGHYRWVDEKSHKSRSDLRGVVHVALALLLVNVLVWVFAATKLKTVYHIIRDNLDVVDTRLLPRPDVGNGVKL